jgi:hypothetical protein
LSREFDDRLARHAPHPLAGRAEWSVVDQYPAAAGATYFGERIQAGVACSDDCHINFSHGQIPLSVVLVIVKSGSEMSRIPPWWHLASFVPEHFFLFHSDA